MWHTLCAATCILCSGALGERNATRKQVPARACLGSPTLRTRAIHDQGSSEPVEYEPSVSLKGLTWAGAVSLDHHELLARARKIPCEHLQLTKAEVMGVPATL